MDKSEPPPMKSEPIPEQNDEIVKVIVGRTFRKIVNTKNLDVLVLFYDPVEQESIDALALFEKLAESQSEAMKIVFGKFDAILNDTKMKPKKYPSLVFYPVGKKMGETFKGDLSLESMTSWLKSYS